MVKRSFACLAFIVIAFASPLVAAPPSTAREIDSQFQAFGAWVQQVTAAVAPMNEAATKFAAQMQNMPPPADDPAVRARQVAPIRAMIADVRDRVQESRSRLARIPRFEGGVPGVPNFDVNRLLTDTQEQTGKMLAYMDDAEAFAAAAARSDPAVTQQAARKLIRGGFLIIENQAILYKGRQGLFPPNRSAHQLVGVGVVLYQAMHIAAEAWSQAHLDGDLKGGARTQKTRFLQLADELETGIRDGRANLASERSFFASQRSRAAKDPNLMRILARTEDVSKGYVESFAMGDELVLWLRARADTPGSVLAAQQAPELILELSAFEQRLLASGSEAAAAIARP